jgi:hypothetical protein
MLRPYSTLVYVLYVPKLPTNKLPNHHCPRLCVELFCKMHLDAKIDPPMVLVPQGMPRSM